MWSPILLKAVSSAGILTVAGISVATALTTNAFQAPSPSQQPSKVIIVNTATSSPASEATGNLTVAGETKNYQCQLSTSASQKDTACKLTLLTFGDKKWLDIAAINSASSTDSIPHTKLQDSANTKNYFKLEVSESFFNQIDLEASAVANVDIVETSPQFGTAKKYGSLTPLFKIDGTTPTYKVATHLVGKVEASPSVTSVETKEYLCNKANNPTDSTKFPCALIDFGNNGTLASEVFAESAAKTTTITHNKHYLLEVKNTASGFTKTEVAAMTTIYLFKGDQEAKTSPETQTSTTWTSSAQLTSLKAAMMVQTDTNKYAVFILA